MTQHSSSEAAHGVHEPMTQLGDACGIWAGGVSDWTERHSSARKGGAAKINVKLSATLYMCHGSSELTRSSDLPEVLVSANLMTRKNAFLATTGSITRVGARITDFIVRYRKDYDSVKYGRAWCK